MLHDLCDAVVVGLDAGEVAEVLELQLDGGDLRGGAIRAPVGLVRAVCLEVDVGEGYLGARVEGVGQTLAEVVRLVQEHAVMREVEDAEQAAKHADGALEEVHIDVLVEVQRVGNVLAGLGKLGRQSHKVHCVERVHHGEGKPEPLAVAAADRQELVVAPGVVLVALPGMAEHGDDGLLAAVLRPVVLGLDGVAEAAKLAVGRLLCGGNNALVRVVLLLQALQFQQLRQSLVLQALESLLLLQLHLLVDLALVQILVVVSIIDVVVRIIVVVVGAAAVAGQLCLRAALVLQLLLLLAQLLPQQAELLVFPQQAELLLCLLLSVLGFAVVAGGRVVWQAVVAAVQAVDNEVGVWHALWHVLGAAAQALAADVVLGPLALKGSPLLLLADRVAARGVEQDQRADGKEHEQQRAALQPGQLVPFPADGLGRAGAGGGHRGWQQRRVPVHSQAGLGRGRDSHAESRPLLRATRVKVCVVGVVAASASSVVGVSE
eukprot:m.120305 g.120305  ORF g.120305 m.120305 type:complete len:490 (+) comp16175_c0_seq1:1546-3015(+)